jgi:hypothetical protein
MIFCLSQYRGGGRGRGWAWGRVRVCTRGVCRRVRSLPFACGPIRVQWAQVCAHGARHCVCSLPFTCGPASAARLCTGRGWACGVGCRSAREGHATVSRSLPFACGPIQAWAGVGCGWARICMAWGVAPCPMLCPSCSLCVSPPVCNTIPQPCPPLRSASTYTRVGEGWERGVGGWATHPVPRWA